MPTTNVALQVELWRLHEGKETMEVVQKRGTEIRDVNDVEEDASSE